MRTKLMLALAACASALLMSGPTSATPAGSVGLAGKAVTANGALVEKVHYRRWHHRRHRWFWHHRHYRPYYYYYYYPYYSYYDPYYYRPYRYYYRPGFSLHFGF
jgi:hypothetical protein